MKSLKRTLSLVLALVMVLGLFGGISMTAAATGFTDDENIQYKEAVDVLTGIGAIAGYPNGDEFSFQPEGTISRAEAAKMVAYTALGPDAPELLKNDVPTKFTDLGDYAWAIPSIEWLVKEGAIHGRSETIYDPGSNVTGYELLKMLLACLGYGDNDEWTPDGWMMNALVLANKLGLIEGRNSKEALSQPANREEAALYSYNTLGAELVSWSPLQQTYVKSGTSAYVDGKNTTLGDDVYKMKTVDVIVASNQAVADVKYTTVRDDDDNSAWDFDNGTPYYLDIETGLDLLGHYVTVYYRDTLSPISDKPTTTYSVIDKSRVVTIAQGITATTGSGDKMKKAFGVSDMAKVTAPDASKAVTFDANTYGVHYNTDLSSAIVLANDATAKIPAGIYVLTDKDRIVCQIGIPTYTADVVTAVKEPTASTTGSITFEDSDTIVIPKTGDTTSGTAKKYAKYKIYDGIKADDVVTIAQTGAFTTVSPTTSVTGTVSEYVATPTMKVTVDGTEYERSTFFNTFDKLKNSVAFDAAVAKEATLYIATDGKVVAMATTEEVTTALVYTVMAYEGETIKGDYGKSTTPVMVQCVDMEGKEVNYTIDVKNGANSAVYDDGNGSTHTVQFLGSANASATPGTAIDVSDFNSAGNANNSGANQKKLCKVTLTPFKDLGVSIAQFEEVTGKTDSVQAGTSNLSIGLTDRNIRQSEDASTPPAATAWKTDLYLGSNTKFMFIDKTGSDLSVTTLPYPQAVAKNKALIYYAESADGKNYDVKYIIVPSAPDTASADAVMFVPEDTASTLTSQGTYTDKDGELQTAYLFNAYIDGEYKTNLMVGTNTQITQGFYTFKVDEYGVYTIGAAPSGVTAVVDQEVTNVHDNTLTDDGPNTNIPFTDNTEVVDYAYLKDALANKGETSRDEKTTVADTFHGKVAYLITKDDKNQDVIERIYYLSDVAYQNEAKLTDVTIKVPTGTGSATKDVTVSITGSESKGTGADADKIMVTVPEIDGTGAADKQDVKVAGKITATYTRDTNSSRATVTVTEGTVPADNTGNSSVLVTVRSEDGSTTNIYKCTITYGSNVEFKA